MTDRQRPALARFVQPRWALSLVLAGVLAGCGSTDPSLGTNKGVVSEIGRAHV